MHTVEAQSKIKIGRRVESGIRGDKKRDGMQQTQMSSHPGLPLVQNTKFLFALLSPEIPVELL